MIGPAVWYRFVTAGEIVIDTGVKLEAIADFDATGSAACTQ